MPKGGVKLNRRHLFVRLITIAIVAAELSGVSHAQLGPKDGRELAPSDLERVKVGQPAPDFTLEGIDGKAISLSSFQKQKNVVLVFFRGHW